MSVAPLPALNQWYNVGAPQAPLRAPVMQDVETGALANSEGPISLGSAGLSGVVYDGSNRAIAFTIGGVTYSAVYGASSITVTGSDSSSVVISLDGSGRISGVT